MPHIISQLWVLVVTSRLTICYKMMNSPSSHLLLVHVRAGTQTSSDKVVQTQLGIPLKRFVSQTTAARPLLQP